MQVGGLRASRCAAVSMSMNRGVEVAVPVFQPPRCLRDRLLHLGDAALPIDELLPKCGYGKPMFRAGFAKSCCWRRSIRFGFTPGAAGLLSPRDFCCAKSCSSATWLLSCSRALLNRCSAPTPASPVRATLAVTPTLGSLLLFDRSSSRGSALSLPRLTHFVLPAELRVGVCLLSEATRTPISLTRSSR